MEKYIEGGKKFRNCNLSLYSKLR